MTRRRALPWHDEEGREPGRSIKRGRHCQTDVEIRCDGVDVRKLRDLFNWEDATKTLGFLLVNLVAVFYISIYQYGTSRCLRSWACFVLSEKSKAIEE